MSTDLTRTLAAIARPLSAPKDGPIPVASRAKAKAREIIDANPGATLNEIVALAYLEGRIDVCNELRPRSEYDRFCQRCGKRDGSVFLAEPPKNGFVQSVCFNCSAGDEPRAA